MNRSRSGGRFTLFIAIALTAATLAGFYLGFDSSGPLTDVNPVLGEPVSEGLTALYDFNVPFSQEELSDMRNELAASLPVQLSRDPGMGASVAEAFRDSIYAATGSLVLAEYFAERVESFYQSGIIDVAELRNSYAGRTAVVDGNAPENISEMFTVEETRDALRFDLNRRGVPQELLLPLVSLVNANITLNAQAFSSSVDAAAASLPQYRRQFQAGDEILPPGGLFTEEASRYWNAMLAYPRADHGRREHNLAKTALAALFLLTGFIYMAEKWKKPGFSTAETLLLFSSWGLASGMTILMARAGVPFLSMFTFTIVGTGLTAVFFDGRARNGPGSVSFFLTAVFAAVFALVSPHPMTTFCLAFIPACITALFIRELTEAGVSLALAGGVVSSIAVYWLISVSGASGGGRYDLMAWILLAGLPLVAVGIVRVLAHSMEMLFRVPSPLTYNRLGSDQHPLRRRLYSEAIGTLKHSMQVAEMAERAAKALGANAETAKLGGIFHDIGKLKRPDMFVENMKNAAEYNPHDDLPPLESARILHEHVTHGVELAAKHNLPRSIRDIIAQHHGDTATRGFLDKARKEVPPGGELDETPFHYSQPRPQTIEAALVMIADNASSNIRGARDENLTRDQKAERIRRTIEMMIDEKQLEDCSLSITQLNRVTHAFLDVIEAEDYDRVKDYPDGR
jgi:cyclic-di-AMP phosphodiesterase PgpH